MLRQLFFTLLFVSSCSIYAQISHGGSPSDILPAKSLQLIGEPAIVDLKEESAIENGPLRYAYPIYTDYTPLNSGSWYDLGNGTLVWQLALGSDAAKSLSINFSRFKLAEGGKVFIYNSDRSVILGSFTSDNNKPSGRLATSPVPGDEIIVELQTPQKNAEQQEIVISEVYHDFLGINDYLKNNIHFGLSGECNVNATCDARITEEMRRSVVKYITNGFLCSGTLVNNTNNDGEPYFLTAAHCVLNQSEAENMVFYFNFESPSCIDSIAGTDQQQLSGADFKAGVENMDFSLVRLSSQPPASYRPYWAGWDRSTTISDAVYTLHHPEGDVKKLSWSGGGPEATTFSAFGFITDGHWLISDWVSGTTEGGSSGAGLFTQENKLIGTLSGGYASCTYQHDDYYARLNKAWDTHSDPSMQLAYWLDPSNSGVLSTEGLDFYSNEVERVTFSNDELTPVLHYSNEFTGPWSGTNDRGYDGFAQYFYDYSSVTIEGVYIVPAICDYSTFTSINVKIWNSIGGTPSDVVFEKSGITLAQMKRREYLIELPQPVQINGEFFIGIELNNPASSDTIALYNVEKNIGSFTQNRAFIRENGSWKGFDELYPTGEKGAFWIDFLGSNMQLSTEVDTLLETQVTVKPNPARGGYVNYATNMEHLSSIELYTVNGALAYVYKRNGEKSDKLALPPSIRQGLYIMVFKNSVSSIPKKVLIFP
nr:trypsin-like peptidase domain-containing protein [uncultured Carboxylicivirga sp.]